MEQDKINLEKKFNSFNKLLDLQKPALGFLKDDPTLFAYFFFKDEKFNRFKALPWQDKFLNSRSKRNLLNCSRQIGKSTCVAIKALHRAFFYPGITVLVVSMTKPQAVELVYRMRRFLNTSFFRMVWQSITPDVKENKHEITLTGFDKEKIESRIIVVPATDAALGFSANYVICDEFARWEGGDRVYLEDLEPTTFWTEGDIDILSTPRGRQGLFYRFFQMPEYWNIFHYDWTANPKNTLEKMEIIRRQHTPLTFAMNYEAKFVASEDSYFTANEINNSISSEANLGWKGERNICVGVDFGKVNDNCVIYTGTILNPEKPKNEHIIRVLDRRVKPLGTDYKVILSELESLNKIIRPNTFVLDVTSGEVPSDILRASGCPTEPFKFTIQSKIEIMNNLKVLMQQGRLQIPNEKDLIEQLEIFQYEISKENQDRMKLHAPEGMHDDEVDALALMAYGLTKSFGIIESSFIKPSVRIPDDESVAKGMTLNNDFFNMLQKNTPIYI